MQNEKYNPKHAPGIGDFVVKTSVFHLVKTVGHWGMGREQGQGSGGKDWAVNKGFLSLLLSQPPSTSHAMLKYIT